ncbi:thiolase family protein [Haloarchaeobius iranensis]|uniref:Acetyl-CoA C-acetyltransferase n=1 Tax=Haloarchaeobius iranensis TaxID=996166 RepID=A0A1G9UEZ1_9EURY|nr:thiolase family protein [Haloarchaeobius iranensis]SDM58468.1 acetyl-CoA C-acetyltransferase [Haloarchaeobius iranensis]
MNEPVIVDAVRTPFGKRDGAFQDTHPQDLAAAPLRALEERNGFDPAVVDDVVYGCVTPKGDQGSNIARIAPLVAGWGEEIPGDAGPGASYEGRHGPPGVQLNRMCGSGQQAINFAAGQVAAGFQDVVVAGGVEHMTREPMGSDGGSMADTYGEHYSEPVPQGESAERIAETWGFDRDDLDELAVDSQRRWGEAWEAGRYDSQVVPVETTLDGEPITVERDGHARPGTDMETLADLPLAFREEGEGVIHAGNSSGIVDGAAATLVCSREVAEANGWEPMARIVAQEVVGVDPVMMLTGPIPATRQLLDSANVTVDDIDLFEVNEAFASVVAAWLEETGAPWERTNVNGGAIAHGHPLGATGAALVTKLVHELERTGAETALSTMCIGFGQGIATLIERE